MLHGSRQLFQTLLCVCNPQDVKGRIERLNRERKLQQSSAGQELGKVHHEWLQLSRKNIEIEDACAKLEEEVYSLRAQLPDGGQPAGNGSVHGPSADASNAQQPMDTL